MKRLDEYLIFNFCKAMIFPTHIHYLELQNPPKFSKKKHWLINVYDLNNPKLQNASGNYFFSFYVKPTLNFVLDTYKITFEYMKKNKRLYYPQSYLYSSISHKRICFLYSLIDQEIENFLFTHDLKIQDENFSNYKLIKTYHRTDYEKYMVLL